VFVTQLPLPKNNYKIHNQMMTFKEYLSYLVENEGADLFLTVDSPAYGRFQGHMRSIEEQPLSNDQIENIAYSVMNAEQREAFQHNPELNLAIHEPGIGRFRLNCFLITHKPQLT
jgi:twitching motility protein PilU